MVDIVVERRSNGTWGIIRAKSVFDRLKQVNEQNLESSARHTRVKVRLHEKKHSKRDIGSTTLYDVVTLGLMDSAGKLDSGKATRMIQNRHQIEGALIAVGKAEVDKRIVSAVTRQNASNSVVG